MSFVAPIREELAGQPYSPQRLDLLARAIVEAHRAAGYLDADARVSAQELGPLLVTSTLEVVPGDPVRLRSIVTRGLRYTRPVTVRREVDLELGARITPEDLERVRSNLYDLQTFRTVDTTLLGDESARDLVVAVGERPRWGFEVGGGLSTDQGIRTFGRATRRNLWGRAHRMDLIGQIGLDYRSDSIRDWVPDLTEPELRAALQYTAPRFPLRRQELVLDILFRERRQERTYRMARSGLGGALDTRFGKHTNLRAGARIELRQFQEVEYGALLEGEPWIAIIDPTASDPSGSTRVQEALTGLLVHDLRDDPVQPRQGVLLSTNAEIAPGIDWGALGPAARFVKLEGRVSTYVPLLGFVLRLSGEGGHGRTFDPNTTIPLEDRYVLGGTGSLRGFARDTLGPRNITPRVDVAWPSAIAPVLEYSVRDDPDRWVPTGGDTAGVGTVELLMPLPALGLPGWTGYSAAVFADIGNTWLLATDARATSELRRYAPAVPAVRVGVGVGLRIATPIGPLQLDVASNLQSASAKGRTRTLLRTDWEESPFRAHLTLGALF
ncbi:MAG: outer membrane protein insertion porin family [Myxococcota bacterium]